MVWGMRDNDQTVRIVHHDTEAAVRLAIQTGGTAVILKPLAVDDVLAIAAGGERVPRKSTSFGPKPRTGLVLRTFATD
ncbi:Related to HTH domain of SpoOJ/ParA/ParB/repB family, involved in chromosome partitioning [[Actinomadura] parvosata subsp. kistnae]|nr:Related to HTH domain of SpoOJ/ParA/ParB/repB family, involved in chromosome partitioning [Actinomadura parvosata subsp. kistnae]